MKAVLLALLLALGASHGAAEEAPDAFLINGVTAHRGGSGEASENTLAAFRHAIALGVDWAELDIYQTLDHQLVVSHDKNTRRTGDRDLEIATTSYAELRSVDVATLYRHARGLTLETCPPVAMPLLSEVLQLFLGQHHTRISIQPKDGSTQAAIDLVRQMHAVPWVGFNDGDLAKMSLVKKMEPSIPVFWDRPARSNATDDLRTARERGFETLVIEQKGATAEWVRQCHEGGVKAGAWTVNDPKLMEQFLAWGMDRLYTDAPSTLLALRGAATGPHPSSRAELKR